MNDRLDLYNRKRRFDETPEPAGTAAKKRGSRGATRPEVEQGLSYVIQEHHARRLHYDFRLELNGALLSWAVPKGPSLDPSVKRLAVHVEDHPVEYGTFEGEIPPGNYGAGTVIVWDRGTWEPVGGPAEAARAYRAGKLKFHLHGDKLHGGWTLVRSHMRGDADKEQWLLIKERDDEARDESEYDILAERPGSVLSGAAPSAGKGKAGKQSDKQAIKQSAGKTRTASVRGDPKRPDIVATRSSESLRELAASPAIEGAVKAKLPASLKPQLATLVDATPPGDDWTYEIKFDGYRVLARIDASEKTRGVQVFTRAGNDWTAKFSKQVKAFAQLGLDSAWLDGEAVVLDENGVPSFQALQNAFDSNRPQDIVVYLFDAPFLNGYDLRGVPLQQRRAILRALLEPVDDSVLRFSNDFEFSADDLLKSACDMALEGIIGKRRDSGYVSGRSATWIKLKCRRRQEFVIGGYSEPSGSRAAFGALLLGVHDSKGKLQYAGRVGTGFDAALLRSVKKELDAHETKRMPFASTPRERSRTPVHWVEPVLVAECNFAEWTSDGIVRQASFVSLRKDKPARQIVKEAPRKGDDVQQQTDIEAEVAPKKRAARGEANKTATKSASKVATKTASKVATKSATQNSTEPTAPRAKKSSPAEVAGVRISHPDRVIDKSTGARKIDLVQYYESVAQWMLPHLVDRPVSLVRAPEDIGGELFFQKHTQKLSIPNITQHPGLDPGHPPLITVDSAKALVGAAQMGTIEFHTWNGVASNIEKPDRVVFDLDPDPSLGWDRMIEAAMLTRSLLEELGLTSFCKTSGGKGLHVVVPLSKHAGWDEVKEFSQAVAQHMASTLPKYFSAKMGAQNRKQKIFVDYLRNNRGSSTVAAFSVRARPGLGVSVPLAWDEVAQTTGGDQWNIENLHERLDELKGDPWADYAKTRQRITAAMRKRLSGA
ncbi:ATP-dependent DNA ligase LigD phosphoesterase module /ATP-dependent DNA ligase LigD polymerase module [Paraburkholderia sp. GV068]|uniref:DNA ligase D n=1 Tax=unclassified Paraburkholderia TaxID=2615204 RepID=UPI000D305DFE|nr:MULTISPECIES: DNA ligase D [unclassified Paraburkholderia]PTR00427.1 ATP-dependent DNA ligase LigD phosphoesterase module /ATP-dependent DNA ligase LigD polymerase module [Paraburkholderia sp. GV072]PUB05275.1 ATP-dependent DNA ligase LigD phosphoesterase module /ATP-dependent DNA ligase LigD polymerase module [Paraburkholderia sp. GV068]